MSNNKLKLAIGALLVLIVLSIQPVSADTLTWHASIKQGANFKWKVSNLSGEITTYFPAFENITGSSIILVNVTGNPPAVGDWSSLVTASSVAFADLYVDSTQITGNKENTLYFLMGPVDIGNSSHGWEAWCSLIGLITWWSGPANFQQSNSTDGDLITYQYNTSGGLGVNQWGINHVITYDLVTGLLQTYTYDYSNTSLSSSVTITIDKGLLGNIPGFEIIPVALCLVILALIPIVRRKK